MKRTVFITAKLQDNYFELIKNGTKKYEVRDESFIDAQVIRYISSSSGNELGFFFLGKKI